jgi:hypothetical protein
MMIYNQVECPLGKYFMLNYWKMIQARVVNNKSIIINRKSWITFFTGRAPTKDTFIYVSHRNHGHRITHVYGGVDSVGPTINL